jgi:shikimate dehydrogenase
MSDSAHDFYTLGVTGYPLGHSLSPQLHAAALRASGLAGEYRLYPIPTLPGGRGELEALLASFRQGGLDGLNVTIPHKQAVISYLDELTPLARQIGAVNTIYRRGQRLVGDNTDADGFMADLHQQFCLAGAPQAALVLGAGGAARAVVHALLAAGWQVTIAARRPQAARQIINRLSVTRPSCRVIELERLPQYIRSLKNPARQPVRNSTSPPGGQLPLALIVNATPVGMFPAVEHSPWPEGLPFPAQACVYDLVYNPLDTTLVRLARSAGLMAASGLGMLIEQAALAFERWTGVRPSSEAMRHSVMVD